MTEVIEVTEVQSVLANCEITEVVRRESSKDGSVFLTGTFDKYTRKTNGKPSTQWNRWNCVNPSVFEKLENALATGERVHLVFEPQDNNYIKKDKAGNEVKIDGKTLWINGTQYRILDIL